MNDEEVNKVFTAITNLEAKVDEGFARIEEAQVDKSEVAQIDAKVDRLIESHLKLEARMTDLEIAMADKADKSDMNRIFNTLDYIVEKLDTDTAERAAQNAQLGRHEERITKLEQSAA